jgi:hypothetical protein
MAAAETTFRCCGAADECDHQELSLAERQGRLGRVGVDHLEWGHAGSGVGDG